MLVVAVTKSRRPDLVLHEALMLPKHLCLLCMCSSLAYLVALSLDTYLEIGSSADVANSVVVD